MLHKRAALCYFNSGLRDHRIRLTGVKSYKAATVNTYLAPIRARVRAQGCTLKGVKQMQGPVQTLDARNPSRLIDAVDGTQWSDKRDVVLRNMMARRAAGQRGARSQDR